MRLPSTLRALALAGMLGAALLGCTSPGQAGNAALPSTAQSSDVPLAARTVWAGSYSQDIQPTFNQYCVSCHGPSVAENGLRLDSYGNVMKGTTGGQVVIPGSPATSTLMTVIQGTADPKIQMPHNARRLSPNRIENIRLWIQAGAPSN
jgi:hypothetical protein